jgi:predicted O-linked N-acetylglucosamine transferase (SPINDLY family)
MRTLIEFIRAAYARVWKFAAQDADTTTVVKPPEPDAQQDDLSLFEQARNYHRHGQLAEAEILYRALLEKYPGDGDLLLMLGTVEGQRNHFDPAVSLIEKAIQIDPDNPAAHSCLGNCLQGQGKYAEALVCYDRSLALKPNDADTLNNRGTALRALTRAEEALASFNQALAINLSHVVAHDNCGITLRELGRPVEAMASHDMALSIDPGFVPAQYHRGIVLAELQRQEEACACFEQILTTYPKHVDALNNLGALLHGLKRFEHALAVYDRLLALAPQSVEALINRGTTLRLLNRHEEALNTLTQARALAPDHAETHFSLGISFGDLRRFEDAVASYDHALCLRPDYVEALNNRGAMLRALRRDIDALSSYSKALEVNPNHLSSLFSRGNLLLEFKRLDEAIADYLRLVSLDPEYDYAQSHLLHARMSCCDWRDIDVLCSTIFEGTRHDKRSLEPFYCVGVASTPDFLRRCSEIYAADKFPLAQHRPFDATPRDSGKIRLGYVAGEFRHQATSILMVELFERHDTARFDVFAFDNGWDDGSDIRKRIASACTEIVDISRDDDLGAAKKVNDKAIDILVNLNGYFGLGRTGVFRYRPAPIQVNWLGFPGTMGAPYMDYIVGDEIVIPAGHEIYFAEKVVRLPDSYQVNDSKRAISAHIPTRAELGLPSGAFVFCCFNNNVKIMPHVFDIWMRVLRKVDHSVLWLLQDNAAAARNLRTEAEARGVTADRLVFAPRMNLPEHLARHQLADLFLDTLPCNAHTTASDALWAGLPVLTCLGDTFAGRVAGSLLRAVGLPELITENLVDYEALALRLAANPAMMSSIRTRLANNRMTQALFDTDRFRRHIESAYTTMYERSMHGVVPESFTVQPME